MIIGERIMNEQQMNVAKDALVQWLSHPQELGKKPAKIEYAGTFILYDMHYYIFKYKKGIFGKWLLGVSGGFVGDELEHCGHVISQMQEYSEATAQEEAIRLVGLVRSYWIERAEEAEERKKNSGSFVNFVLLKEAKWDKEQFLKVLEEEWKIRNEVDETGENEEYHDTLVISYHGYMIAVGLIDTPVPNGEAEYYAQRNIRWKEAVEVTKTHRAHLMVAVMGKEKNPKEAGEVLVKTIASCCKSADVIGIYGCETVFQTELYMRFAEMMKEGMFPLFNLVWFGIYKSEKGFSGYTSGLSSFGKDEIEVIDSKTDPNELANFLSDIANYILEYDAVLRDGETIGFTADQKLVITRSEGVAVEGMSLKIGY